MLPLISVLVPLYNVEKYVEKFLRSLLSNTIINKCEIIIVNDCTPDSSLEIINKVLLDYKELQNNIIIINHEKNRGLAAARNTAFENATGEYIICADSDDWVEPNYLEELYNKAKSGNYDIVGCDLFSEFTDKTIIKKQPLNNIHFECINDLFSIKINGWLWIKLIKRSLLIDNNIRWIEGLNVLEDLLLSVKCFFYAESVGYVETPLYHYNHNVGSYMYSLTNDSTAKQIIQVINEVELFLKSKNRDDLLNNIDLQKLHLKSRLLFKGDEVVRYKYLSLWPEANSKLKLFKTNIIRKIILCNSIKHPNFTRFLISAFYISKNIIHKKII